MTRLRRGEAGSLLAAVVLPLILFASLQAAFSMRSLRLDVEADALNRARAANAAIDSRLLADQSALAVLATSQFIVTRDWPQARERVARVQATRPVWKTITLTELATGATLFDTSSGSGALPPQARAQSGLSRAPPGSALFRGMAGRAPGCPCVAIQMPVWEQGAPRYLLTLERGTEDFEPIIKPLAPPGGIAAVVDREGLFIARSAANRARLGRPATHYVREAIRTGDQGLYSGVTYEGLKNYTAFVTSPRTGWSTHVAIKASSLTNPSLGSLVLTLAGAVASLLLAAIMILFILRRDRTRRREEARSAQSQKLAAIGQLASGIAHDFNNLLMVIDASLRKIAGAVDNRALDKPLANALAASERGGQLISQLMAFTRSGPLDIGPIDLGALGNNMRGLIEQSVGRAISVHIAVDDDARHVLGAVGPLELAILNLSVNARDAMPNGGVLTLRTRVAANRADLIELIVSDTGEGMPREVVARAMEPFFTTKPLGKGTGLGLAQVFGVVTQSGGEMEIDSAPGAGTAVILRLRRSTVAGATLNA